ncbi:MAG: 50S ribosomal protein L31, partial [Victivallaceae bacterium]
SSSSHPFFTGSKQFIDTEGRVDKFLKRYGPKKTVAKPEEESVGAGSPDSKKTVGKSKKKK